jgi:hypothetical protein
MLPSDGSADAAGIVGSSRIAVLVPCYNEEAAIGKVAADFQAALPDLREACFGGRSKVG